MNKHTLIIGILFGLTGCGSNSSSSTPSDQAQGSNSEIPAEDMSSGAQNEATPVNGSAIFIDCSYSDNYNTSYKIENNLFYSFSTTSNSYVSDVIYGISQTDNRSFAWMGKGQEGYNNYNTFTINVSEDKFEVVLGNVFEDSKLKEFSNPSLRTISINRKTGSMTQYPKILGNCYPGQSKVIEKNSF